MRFVLLMLTFRTPEHKNKTPTALTEAAATTRTGRRRQCLCFCHCLCLRFGLGLCLCRSLTLPPLFFQTLSNALLILTHISPHSHLLICVLCSLGSRFWGCFSCSFARLFLMFYFIYLNFFSVAHKYVTRASSNDLNS